MVTLRPYQEACLSAIEDKAAKGCRRQLVTMATGGGKTVVFAELIRRNNKPTLVLAHTNELLEQAREKIRMIQPSLEVGIVNADKKEIDAHVVVSSIQSARQPDTLRLLKERDFQLAIADEAHRSAAESFRDVLDGLGFGKKTDKLLVGFTATPFRQDGKGLGEIFDEIVFEKPVGELIEEGHLVYPRGVRVSTDLKLDDVTQRDGDYSPTALSAVMDTPEVRGLTVEAYEVHGEGAPTICFTTSVAHAQRLAEDFKASGKRAMAIHGGTPKAERAHALRKFCEGQVDVLTNCAVLTEGFDAPITGCVIVARPTKSLGLYQQMVGRGLRKHPNKHECIVIDFNDTAHTLCTASALLPDAERERAKEKERREVEERAKRELPKGLNRKLQRAYITANLFSQEFNWRKEGSAYMLKGSSGRSVRIEPADSVDSGLYDVIAQQGSKKGFVAQGLSFEYAFSAAEDFAIERREAFILSDREAAWRKDPISDRQRELFRKSGYRKGIEHLNRGQASDLIAVGALKRAQ